MVSAISVSNTDLNLPALSDSLSTRCLLRCCLNQTKAQDVVYIEENFSYFKSIKFSPITHTILNIQMRKLVLSGTD